MSEEMIEVDVGPGRSELVPLSKMAVPIAPGCGWTGKIVPKPWEYAVTIVLPHLETLPQLDLAVKLWRLQTVRPYFLVLDTGSAAELLPELEKLRRPDCEIHFIRAHGYAHSSHPVSAALDLAHGLCRTPYLFHTHTDVFPRRRDFLAWMLEQTNEQQPVVGWRMSPRDMSTSRYRGDWRSCVSHTATMLHMPTVHRAGLTWSLEAYYAWRPEERGPTVGWPDTESAFLLSMRRARIRPVFLGDDLNWQPLRNEWFDHIRSLAGLKLDAKGGDFGKNLLLARCLGYLAQAEAEAKARLAQWTCEAKGGGA